MLKIVARNKKESKYICSEKMMRGGLFLNVFRQEHYVAVKKIFLMENMHNKVHIKKQKKRNLDEKNS